MSLYTKYVERESDLNEFINDRVFTESDEYYEGRVKGWGKYYEDHKIYFEGGDGKGGLWNNLTDARKEDFIDKAKKSTFYDIHAQVSPNVYIPSRAAKRLMARDWHKGMRYFAGQGLFKDEKVAGSEPNGTFISGKDRGHDTYTIFNHGADKGDNVIRLNETGSDFKDQTAKNNAYENFGQSHWDTQGKYEARALPGTKFSVKNGKLTYDKNFVGEGKIYNEATGTYEPDPNNSFRGAYDKIASNFNDSSGDNYATIMNYAGKIFPDYAEDFYGDGTNGDLNLFSAFYLDNKVTKRAASDYAQPPTGKFEASYYATTENGLAAGNTWENAQTSVLGLPDLDVVGAYGNNYDLYLHGKYTDIKDSGISDNKNRGNAAEATALADAYAESYNTLSDAEKETYRDDLLGLTKGTPSGGRTIDWDDPFLLDEEGNIQYETDEFGNNKPILNPESISILEGSVFNVFGKKDLEEQDKFQAIALDLLKTSVDELDQQRKRERELDIYRGLPGFNEIYGANSSIANSLIGDSGIGGYLSMGGYNVDQMTESLENQLSGATGISNNSSVYNWQKWFDETLLERYETLEEVTGKLSADIENLDPILDTEKWNTFKETIESLDPETQPEEWSKLLKDNNLATGLSLERALEIKDPGNWNSLLEKYDLDPGLTKEATIDLLSNSDEEIKRIYTIEDEFRNEFIEDFIKPRFDKSKSMDEFISYLDTLDEDEQNVFQTEDAMTALKSVASAYSSAKLRQIRAIGDRNFDAEFYMDPTSAIDSEYESPEKDANYRKQKETLEGEYALALANPNSIIEGTVSETYPEGLTWAQYAYKYGVDINNKEQFARLHYDAIGSSRGYDPAKDVTSYADIQGYIVNTVIPKVSEAKLETGVFSDFTTPEAFADELLKGIDPTENNPEWKEILEQFGLDAAASLDELKDYIIDITRTGAAKEIRESIKYLNEKKLKPTQERLGVSYISRDEDQKDIDPEDQSSLFTLFANSGYAGTEDEFFSDFMPDADRGDLELIEKGLSNDFELSTISDDPFEALASVGSMFGDEDDIFSTNSDKDNDQEESSDYFNLFPEEKEDYYSDAGRDYISEYTAFFK